MMAEYQQTQTIGAPAGDVFAWLSDVDNLPKYLPPVTDASVEGPSAEGTPGQRLRATLEYPGGGSFDSEGYFSVDEDARRLEWGAEVQRDYSGWLTVAEADGDRSEVTVHLRSGRGRRSPRSKKKRPRGGTRSRRVSRRRWSLSAGR